MGGQWQLYHAEAQLRVLQTQWFKTEFDDPPQLLASETPAQHSWGGQPWMPSCCCACWWKLLWAAGTALPPTELEKGKCLLYATIHAFVLSDQTTSPSEFCICGVERPGWSKNWGGQGATEVCPALSGVLLDCQGHSALPTLVWPPHLWE